MLIHAAGRIAGGKLTIRNRREFDRLIGSWRDCPVTLTVERAHATRSKAQNDYYHAVVVGRILASGKVTRLQPRLLKRSFAHHSRVEGLNGTLINGLVIAGSTKGLNKLQFIEYLEAIVGWAAREMGYLYPRSDPLWSERPR